MESERPALFPSGASTEAVPPDRLHADLVRSASDAIIAMDQRGDIIFWNDAAEALFGWTADEIVGRAAARLIPEDQAREQQRIAQDTFGSAQQAAMEAVYLHKDGTRIPVSCRVSPLKDSEGRVYGASAVMRENSRELALRRQLERNEQEAHVRFTHSVIAQITADLDGRIIAINDAAVRLGGWSSDKALLGRPIVDLMPPEDRAAAADVMRQLRTGQREWSEHQRRLVHADGHVLETRSTVFPVHDESGQVIRFEGTWEDITASVVRQQALAESEEKWRRLALHAADVAFLTDADGVIRYVSAAITHQFGYRSQDVVGQVGFDFFHPDDEPAVRAHWARAVAEPSSVVTFEARVRGNSGEWRWIEETVTNSLRVPGLHAMVANLVDITDRRRARELADRVVSGGSRDELMAALDVALKDQASAHRVGLVLFDLDRFKLVNRTHGHRIGDALLAAIGERLREHTFEGELVARMSGDRFAVLLDGVETIAGLSERTAELQAVVAAATTVDGLSIPVTASAGAAHGPATTAVALLQAAEAALVEAKSDISRPRRAVEGTLSSSGTERALLIEDLRRGLLSDELAVHYQPVVSLSDGRVSGVEALVRWRHPDDGLVGPDRFIDAAEESGLIVEIGRLVLDLACAAAARWAHLGSPAHPFQVAVNLSAKQLATPGVVALVRTALAAAGAQPQYLVLEVTESAVMADVDATSATLRELRRLGLSIAVDDFGTGYSSLTYVKRVPVTRLKIDRSFVGGLGVDADDDAIVASVVSLSRAIRVDCIAEGVETDEQRRALQAMGCDYAQGFLWSPAVDADAFDDWQREHDPAAVLADSSQLSSSSVTVPDLPAPPPLLARILALQSEGASLRTIAAALNAEHVLTPEGKRWHPRSVAQIIASHGPLS
jgi:PAS domain S-box-containing protein/diguanylate cyclase (GGDEF)-like protein